MARAPAGDAVARLALPVERHLASQLDQQLPDVGMPVAGLQIRRAENSIGRAVNRVPKSDTASLLAGHINIAGLLHLSSPAAAAARGSADR
jgi:hypothetical protein